MRMPGGGNRQYSEDTQKIAWIMLGVLMFVFFALVIRLHFDRLEGRADDRIRLPGNPMALRAAILKRDAEKQRKDGSI